MKATDHRIAGLILAAGASERMGNPKALLEYADGATLLQSQQKVLVEAGCVRIIAVIGAAAERVRSAHPDLEVTWVVNDAWEAGQFSSLKAGIETALASNESGIIVLPVDAAGVTAGTVGSIIETALRNPHLDVVIPEFEEKGGHPVYLSSAFCKRIAKLDPSGEDARLDVQIREAVNVMRLPVNDPGITRNINTPEDWEEFRRRTPA